MMNNMGFNGIFKELMLVNMFFLLHVFFLGFYEMSWISCDRCTYLETKTELFQEWLLTLECFGAVFEHGSRVQTEEGQQAHHVFEM